ncbi:unnamed protein product [Rodentolepis nana]|uniref:NopRA1 domain-containing protein n=1 Tax=Rodentolepis nana TaxID=102285 RepID=A0A0R3TY13_RODNA|nr:unnamed protein product [Rodentolepis nana]
MPFKIGKNFIEVSRLLPLLPYADQLDSYAEIAGNGLKESLRRLLSSSTYSCHNDQIPRYIYSYIQHFGMRFTKKEVIDLIQFGLSLVLCQQVDKSVRDRWRFVVINLLRRVWLDEIIHIWYQHFDLKAHVEVVNLLAKFAHLFPGRLDMDLHLDRIFNSLVTFYLDKINYDSLLCPSAKIIANSLTPDSNVLKLLRHFFHISCHVSSENAKRAYFPIFCCELVKAVLRRLERELHYNADMKEHLDEVVDWGRFIPFSLNLSSTLPVRIAGFLDVSM